MSFNFDSIVGTIKDAMTTKTVIGEPLEFGNVTIVPVMSVYFGFGGGGGPEGADGGGNSGAGGGGAGGGGARLKVSGIIVIKDDEVEFLPTGRSSSIGKIVDIIPDIIQRTTTAVKGDDDDTEPEDEA